jgi:hypothetical protein
MMIKRFDEVEPRHPDNPVLVGVTDHLSGMFGSVEEPL